MKIDSYLGTSVLSERSELNGNLVVSRAFTFNTTAGSANTLNIITVRLLWQRYVESNQAWHLMQILHRTSGLQNTSVSQRVMEYDIPAEGTTSYY